MKTVVLVERDRDIGDLCATWLEDQGYRVVTCLGPDHPEGPCPAWQGQPDCPLAEEGDLLIYDPWLAVSPGKWVTGQIITHHRQRYPGKPVLVVGSGVGLSVDVARLEEKDDRVHALPLANKELFIAAVRELVGAPEPTNSSGGL